MKFIGLSLMASLALVAGEKTVKFESLPSAVQAAMKAQTQGSTIVGYSKEVDKGKTTYEVETKMNGKTRDMEFDPSGKLLITEQEIDMSDVPTPAKAAIEKQANGAKITKIEKVTEGPAVRYEAVITKGKKSSEFVVNPDGSVHH
jgi:uncharacterized membrane protein YkoI